MRKIKIFSHISLFALLSLLVPTSAHAQLLATRDILFPVIGTVTYGNDFGDPRDGGARTHEGNDILGKKMQPLVAAVDGTISFASYPQASYGYTITIKDKDGYTYHYLHMNNDTPGTDDGKGDGINAYAVDMMRGNTVVRGQLIGYMGDSGNAEGSPAHLHFEIRAPGGDPLNPYDSLKAAKRAASPVVVYPEQAREILPYGDFRGGMNVAAGNLDSDSDGEIITAAGPGGGPLVRVFKKDKTPVKSFYAYGETFRGGVDVASADVDGDGVFEIITAAGPGGGPHIKIFKADGTVLKEFFAYDVQFRGGVQVGAGDIDGDGKAEIITGPGPGGGPHIRVFKADGTVLKEFFAYGSNFSGGVDVAIIPKTNQTTASLITAPLSKGGPHIKVFDQAGLVIKEFFAYDASFQGGVRVSAASTSAGVSQFRIMTIPANGGGPHLKMFTADGVLDSENFFGFEEWSRGGYDIAGYNGTTYAGSRAGARRASLRSSEWIPQTRMFSPNSVAF